MNNLQKDLLTVLQRLHSALERLTPEDISKILDESHDIEIKLVRKRHKEVVEAPSTLDLESVVSKLTEFASRDEALTFLSSFYTSRKLLEQIARGLDIPILKQDNIETLRDKVIEATTGARLRSKAIQGEG